MLLNIKCAYLNKLKKPLIIESVFFDKLKPGQVLVKIFYSGICKSQLMEILGARGKDKWVPHALGHEGVGEVIEIGKGVKKVKKGDKVILTWLNCKGKKATPPKFYTHKKKKINAGRITTFSNYTIVSENRILIKPKSIKLRDSLLYGCALATGGGIIINQIKPKKTSKVMVIGLGGVGVSSLITLKALGVKKIYGLDNSINKIKLVKRLKICKIFNSKNKNEMKYLKKIIKNGADYCVEATSISKSIEFGFSLLNDNGKMVFASHPKNGDKISLDPYELIKGKKIEGSWGGNFIPEKDIKKLSKILSKKTNLSKLISKDYSLSEINKAIEDLKLGRVIRPVVKMEH